MLVSLSKCINKFSPESPQKVSKIEIAKHIPNYREDDKMIKWDNV